MPRLIDADALIIAFCECPAFSVSMFKKVRSVIQKAKVIEAEPVVHTKWEIEMDDMGWNKHTCPNCGYVKRTDIHVSLGWNYCPNCGAKMDGGAENG